MAAIVNPKQTIGNMNILRAFEVEIFKYLKEHTASSQNLGVAARGRRQRVEFLDPNFLIFFVFFLIFFVSHSGTAEQFEIGVGWGGGHH